MFVAPDSGNLFLLRHLLQIFFQRSIEDFAPGIPPGFFLRYPRTSFLRLAFLYWHPAIPSEPAVSCHHRTSRDQQAAAKLYDEIAADRSVGAAEQDLARIRAAQLLPETATYPNMKERLEASAAPGATFRHTARELLALSAWRANDAAATRQWLDMIANDGETPPSLRSRAEALQALLPPVAKS